MLETQTSYQRIRAHSPMILLTGLSPARMLFCWLYLLPFISHSAANIFLKPQVCVVLDPGLGSADCSDLMSYKGLSVSLCYPAFVFLCSRTCPAHSVLWALADAVPAAWKPLLSKISIFLSSGLSPSTCFLSLFLSCSVAQSDAFIYLLPVPLFGVGVGVCVPHLYANPLKEEVMPLSVTAGFLLAALKQPPLRFSKIVSRKKSMKGQIPEALVCQAISFQPEDLSRWTIGRPQRDLTRPTISMAWACLTQKIKFKTFSVILLILWLLWHASVVMWWWVQKTIFISPVKHKTYSCRALCAQNENLNWPAPSRRVRAG